MSAEVLEQKREDFRKYHTETGPVDANAKTTPGVSGLAAAELRKGPRFLQEVAALLYLVLDELARHRRSLDRLQQRAPTQQPAPLPLAQTELGQELGQLRNDLDTLGADLTPKVQGLLERTASLEHSRDHGTDGVSPFVAMGVCVVCMLISSLGAVVVLLTALVLRWS